MEIIRKYTAIQMISKRMGDDMVVDLSIGFITQSYGYHDYPKEEFDTEEEAINWAHKENEYARWLILPIIKFE